MTDYYKNQGMTHSIRALFAVIAVSAALSTAQERPSVSIDEAKIRAVLRSGETAVIVPVSNHTDQVIKSNLSLAWLSVDEEESNSAGQEITLQPGQSEIETPLPLVEPSIWTRLRYSLVPERADARSFAPINGIVSLPHIADYVFELKVAHLDVPYSGTQWSAIAQAVHPLTRRPLLDIEWSAKLTVSQKAIVPTRIRKYDEGFAEFLFDVPIVDGKYGYSPEDIEVSARRGDFSQAVAESVHVFNRLSARIQSDKPIYQPGQVMHLRAIILNPRGQPASGAKILFEIKNPDNDTVHTAQLVASEFGIIRDDWQIPDSSSLGQYELELHPQGDYDYWITQHIVRVSRYELPVFRIDAKTDRTAYLPTEQPKVTITGTYLFGKPVPRGRVKIVRTSEPEWNDRKRRTESSDETVAEGNAGESGEYTVQLDLKADHQALEKSGEDRYRDIFKDIHFAAYYTDPASGRTEQRRFDIRITREPIHIYVIDTFGGGALPVLLYISTSYADGRPAITDIAIRSDGQTLNLRTNKQGLGKIMVVSNTMGRKIEIKAVDATGKTGTRKMQLWYANALLRIETGRSIYRAGDSVTLEITTPPDSAADQFLMIHATSDSKIIASRIARIANHKGVVTFPYQKEFRKTVLFGAWNAVDARSDYIATILGGRAVVFPDSSDLSISAAAERPVYKPGEKATLRIKAASDDGNPVEAAFGVAVVDQAVLERARTDMEFGNRPWFACAYCYDEAERGFAGLKLNDLYGLKPESKITPELDLAAEALMARVTAVYQQTYSESLSRPPEFEKIESQTKQLSDMLNQRYLDAFEFPQDSIALSRILGDKWRDLRDPWGKPYWAEFRIQYQHRQITLLSAGPDKQRGTGDDLVAGTFRRSYFAPLRALIEEALKGQQDYPANDTEFAGLLKESGLLFDSLKDPWGSPYYSQTKTIRARRDITINSSGPDRQTGTNDDIAVANFTGSYFGKEKAQISEAIQRAAVPPRTIDDFHKILENAGIPVSGFRDAWNQPYRATAIFSSGYYDRTNDTIVRVFGGSPTTRTDVVPVVREHITFSLYSIGPDAIEDTRDDFDVASFQFIFNEQPVKSEESLSVQSTSLLKGSGAITGLVTDMTGGILPGVTISLITETRESYISMTDREGCYSFMSISSGIYSVRAELQGFKNYIVNQIPVMDGKTTNVDIEMQVAASGVIVEINVAADPIMLESSSSIGTLVSQAATATPRVRDYFPETLYWIPELITDARGVARAQIPPADTVTTWKIAAVASTLDGRIAESESEFRTFQPFFLDFNPPLVLTQGDTVELPVTIRNYQDQSRKVGVRIAQNSWSEIQGPADRQVTVPANGSVNVSYGIQAKRADDKASQRIAARAGRDGDAIEKSLRVHPDGQEVKRIFGDLMTGQTSFNVMIPPAAIEGATRGELRIFPNMASLLLESASAILDAPRGCAEQTISAGYANLVAWRFARAAGIADAKIEKRALENVRIAVDSLSTYQTFDGGVRYWSGGEPDIAVTSHALNFLVEASAVISVDPDEIASLVSWLESNQQKDGRWAPRDTPAEGLDRRALLLTGTAARSLASAQKAGVTVNNSTLSGAYHHIAQFTDSIDEPYMLANFVSAALDSGNEALLGNAVSRLLALTREERGGIYWDLQTNSPFYGWGTAGRYETTGLVISALAAWRAAHPASTELDSTIRRGLVFLLRGRDSRGTWLSTQSTLRTMRALADASSALGSMGNQGGTIEVRVNERSADAVRIPDDPKATDPIYVNLSSLLSKGENRISLTPTAGMQAAMSLFTSTYWLPWEQTEIRKSPEFQLDVEFDRLEARAGDLVQCSVQARRIGFRGYGMMIAEIGLPPGAEVDRSSLETVMENDSTGVNHYEVLPDRVLFYLWPKAEGSSFSFHFSARMPMIAKSAPFILYDYYNPEALSELPPVRWIAK